MSGANNYEYMMSLHNDRWPCVRCTTGKGLEISDNPFMVFPLAVKVLHEDNDQYAVRFLAKDFRKLDEVADKTLDYIFVTEPEQKYIFDESINNWTQKLVDDGYLILHRSNAFEVYQKSTALDGTGYLKPWTYPVFPANSVAVIRYGAFGDLMQASSVIKGLKEQGHHVVLYASNPGAAVVTHDPNIDEIVIQTRDQVRNNELGLYWNFLKTKHARIINLCESVEKTWLAKSSDINFTWPIETRNKYLNGNYVEFQHHLAGVKNKSQVKFYPTQEEITWAQTERKKMAKKVILWSLSGSSVHKVFPYLDEFVARVMLQLKDTDVVLVGGPEAYILQGGWQNESRVHKTVGEWSIRQSLVFAQQSADLVIGPETGVLNAVCMERVPKIIFLSHSTVNNLTRDWVNTYSMTCPKDELAKCESCCLHRLHTHEDGWQHIKRDEETGAAHCQAKMDRNELWRVAVRALGTGRVY
jgi:ADP-heptose:LPS heptosyltransferase